MDAKHTDLEAGKVIGKLGMVEYFARENMHDILEGRELSDLVLKDLTRIVKLAQDCKELLYASMDPLTVRQLKETDATLNCVDSDR